MFHKSTGQPLIKDYKSRKPTFIDLGCGNGLLTFLLVSEGYDGYGIDIADRKIWPALCKNHKHDMLRGINYRLWKF